MWTTSATAHTTASPATVWEIYCDTVNWSKWDLGLERYELNGPFATGTEGTIQPVGGPAFPFQLLFASEGQRFDDNTPLGPETALIGRHVLTPAMEGTQITHIVDIVGPNAAEIAREMDFTQEALQETVDALARYAEERGA